MTAPRALAILLLGAAAVFAAERDPWSNVRDLKSGLDVRIFKKGATRAMAATLFQTNEDSLIVVVGRSQVAIPKDEIDRLDYRPPQDGRPGKRRIQTTSESPVVKNGEAPVPRDTAGTVNMSTRHEFGVKPGFETIYRRPLAEEAK